MRAEPELFVPASEARRAHIGGWRLALLRAWCVLGCFVAWFVFIAGSHELHWSAALYTLGGFFVVWKVAAWIFRPVLPPNDEQR